MNKKYIKYIIITIITFIILLIISIFIYNKFFKAKTFPSVDKLIKEKEKINYKDNEDIKINVNNYDNELPSLRNQYNNNDIKGILEIPNLNINSIVMRTNDNKYYLSYSVNREYDRLGVPFFDYRNTDLVNDRQINIYGHNTTNKEYYSKLPFVNVDAYSDKNIFDNYKDVYLSIDEKQVKYKVVAVKVIVNKSSEHMRVKFDNDLEYLKHINRMLDGALYKEENLSITNKDRVLVMQVCHYNPPDSYLIVICKEVK